MADFKEQGEGSHSQNPEWKHDFSPGPSEEEIARFKGPEWRSELPDIRMQGPPGDNDKEPNLREDWERRYGLGYVSPSGMVEGLSNEIKRLREIESRDAKGKDEEAKKEKEIEKRKEHLVDRYTEIGHEMENQLREVVQFFEDMQGNPYPYDSRGGEFFFRDLLNSIDKSLRDPEISSADKGILKRLKQEALYADGSWTVMVAVGVTAVPYYDAIDEMGTLVMPHKKLPERAFERVFQRLVRGVELSPAHKEVLSEVTRGVRSPEVPTLLEGLRETATKFHAENFFWRAGAASAHQWDHDNPPPSSDAELEPNGRLQMYLHPRELKFFQLVFGQGEVLEGIDEENRVITKFKHALNLRGGGVYEESDWLEYKGRRVPQTLLNWYAMGESEENMESYQAIMETLLLRDTKSSLDKILEIQDEEEAQRQLGALATKIKEEALKRVKDWEAGGERGLRGRLSELVVWSGIIQDWGFMSAGEFGWGWSYKIEQVTDKNKDKLKDVLKIRGQIKGREVEFAITRKSGVGGIYATFDIPSAMFWANKIINYHENAETTSVLMMPSDSGYRKKFETLPPHEYPKIPKEEVFAKDPVLRKAHQRVFGEGLESKKWRNHNVRGDEKLGEMDPEVRKFLQENMWFWGTPFYDPREPDNKLYFPVFFPPFVKLMNFWRGFNVTTATEIGKIQRGPSVFDQMLARKDLRDIPYMRMRRHMVDRYRVNMDMFRRILRLYVNPHVFDRAGTDEFRKFIIEGGTTSLKEADKRTRLGWERDQNIKSGAGKLALIPMTVVLGTIRRHSLFSSETMGDSQKRRGWRQDIRDIIYACLDLPSRHDEIVNFNGSMAQMVYFYATVAYRIASSEYFRTVRFNGDIDKFIRDEWSSDFPELEDKLVKASGAKI